MDNVIRPNFGRKAPEPQPPAHEDEHALRMLGQAGAFLVGLIEDEDGPEGPSFKVVVGPCPGDTVEAVAVMPATPAGRIDAEMVGMAVLRTLELVAEQDAPGIA
ncbi:hypothetical protein [Methylobacterium dankookense]|uniref:Uncharacterized protein n=1 Tax=Methylobacterium dankookense TaxID=560405 RepID=A0A564FV50_9HYPH|nr:hypothetical protein [Methylobacterium dankookense]GJD58807.1 hypothetical protein IFDJLNFL_4731 [Methylobacterium dankookense]VUF11560.1 hypothetical protein MTDSW087_01242 [Methylobacterium dankookense]